MQIKMWQSERTVTIKGAPAELEELAQELQSWTPTNGWSRTARDFFDALKGIEEE